MRSLLAALLLSSGCGPAQPPAPLWPDQSHVLEDARRTAQEPAVVRATDPNPAAARMGFASWSETDSLTTTWARLGSGLDASPQAFRVVGAEPGELLEASSPRVVLSRAAGSRHTIRHLQEGRIDCGRLPSDRFLMAVFSDVQLVAVAELPGPPVSARTLTLLRAPTLPEESPREMTGKVIGTMANEPFYVAATREWSRRIGLERRGNELKASPEGRTPRALLGGEFDYVLWVAADQPDLGGEIPAVDISRIMTSGALYQDLLVCSRHRIADHRRDLVEQLARWMRADPTAAPAPVSRADIQKLSKILMRAGILTGDTPLKSFIDTALVPEARTMAAARTAGR